MILNTMMFWLMVVEATVCLIISLPFGRELSQRLIQFVSSHVSRDSNATTVVTSTLVLVAVLFASDVNTTYQHSGTDEDWSDSMRIHLLTAQRNMYISGFCLFLFLLLRLVYISLETNLKLEKSLNAMKKQAQSASNGYTQLLEENENITKQLKKVNELLEDEDESDGKSNKAANVLSKLVAENNKLTSELSAAQVETKNLGVKMETLRKQADGQSSAYMKLVDEKTEGDKRDERLAVLEKKLEEKEKEMEEIKKDRDSLRSQVQDYDFMFADARKKAD